MTVFEVNFDGLVGPTHHYGGLAKGNFASQQNRNSKSYPREAALQGLEKMKLLMDLGLKQAVLPPHPRPNLEFLRVNGFHGSAAEMVESAARTRPDLLSLVYSAASMWAANSATVSPSVDTANQKVWITPANMISSRHRSLEAEVNLQIYRTIFQDRRHFVVSDPLPRHRLLADEGAANQLRLTSRHERPGLEVFVYGRNEEISGSPAPRKFAARQTLQASERIAAQHKLPPNRQLFLQQNPIAIDAGVFHNDVIAMSNENVLICHEYAFCQQQSRLQKLRSLVDSLCIIEVSNQELDLRDAVSTYLFNSQLVTLPASEDGQFQAGEMMLIAPIECQLHSRARNVIERILDADNPVKHVRYIDIRQSMKNGGGPACLRLRVTLNSLELSRVQGNIFLTPVLYEQLSEWVKRHYREELTISDLADVQLVDEVDQALTELDEILGLDWKSAEKATDDLYTH